MILSAPAARAQVPEHAAVWARREADLSENHALAQSPDGRSICVVGQMRYDNYSIACLNAVTGNVEWKATWSSAKPDDFDSATAMAFDASGDRLFVTGTSGYNTYVTLS